MSLPSTYRAFRRTMGPWPHTIELVTETLPDPTTLKPKDVVIKIHAVALNYRDDAMLREGGYPMPTTDGGIPASDCAAEVVAVGSAVTEYKIGDRVATILDLTKLTGEEINVEVKDIGGSVDGLLREYGVFDESALVHLPDYLSWEEASTIPCAGATAWNSLGGSSLASRSGPRGSSALLQGTGGVSMFALILCTAAGITPIITSSSDEKLEFVKKMHPSVLGYNYKKETDQAAAVKRLTNGRGVDFVVKNTGPGSLPEDVDSLRPRYGQVSIVGFLDGWAANWDRAGLVLSLMAKQASLQGILPGSKREFVEVIQFIGEKKVTLKPLIDRVFDFRDSKEAFKYLSAGKHVGKVVIKM